jgi:hypothetical protein
LTSIIRRLAVTLALAAATATGYAETVPQILFDDHNYRVTYDSIRAGQWDSVETWRCTLTRPSSNPAKLAPITFLIAGPGLAGKYIHLSLFGGVSGPLKLTMGERTVDGDARNDRGYTTIDVDAAGGWPFDTMRGLMLGPTISLARADGLSLGTIPLTGGDAAFHALFGCMTAHQ